MTLAEFTTWSLAQGTVCKTDGGYCGECVSLINQYLSKVHNIQAGAWGHAKAWANSSNPIRGYFTAVNSSQAGDIGVTTAGTYGHIWVYRDKDILEQNGRVAKKVTISPDRNATVILRPKAGMPQAPKPPQGGGMADTDYKVNTDINRIIHSEMEGWPYQDTHNGKFDKEFAASWGGRPVKEMLEEKWVKNGPWRERREAALKFYDKYVNEVPKMEARIKELESQPNNEYEEVGNDTGLFQEKR